MPSACVPLPLATSFAPEPVASVASTVLASPSDNGAGNYPKGMNIVKGFSLDQVVKPSRTSQAVVYSLDRCLTDEATSQSLARRSG